MKKYIYILIAVCGLSLTACNYLDMNPDTGITEEEVFSTLDNYKSYFRMVYNNSSTENYTIKVAFPFYLDGHDLRFSWNSMTDASDAARLVRCQQMKAGSMGANSEEFTTSTGSGRRPISKTMFRLIRVCNKSIANIDMLTNASEEDKNDLLGQAYFVRGFCHFTLCRIFGGMPYIDKALGADDEWDMVRMTRGETYRRCAEDFQTAYEYLLAAGKMRRDALPGQVGHLSHSEIEYPNGCAALAMKARALLYAASPLNNENGQADWVEAAEACAVALKASQEWKYEMVPFVLRTNNFWGVKYTNEEIWAYNAGSFKGNSSKLSGLLAYPMSNYSNSGGDCPTQNLVDKFETVYGDPLETEADRAAAIAAGHYRDQDPYSDRDPRLDQTIVHDGSEVAGSSGPINIYYDPVAGNWPSSKLGSSARSFGDDWGKYDGKTPAIGCTGYYGNKWWNGQIGTASAHQHTDPLIRVAELYLNYAEAVNEAYGPSGTAGGLDLTALQAVNTVRYRADMPAIQERFTGSTEALRERIQNERNVEFALEGHHYYHDTRRWMTAPQAMSATQMGMYIESVPVSAEYPKGRKYERRALPSSRQSMWKSAMYFIPFPVAEANKMKNFVNNEIW